MSVSSAVLFRFRFRCRGLLSFSVAVCGVVVVAAWVVLWWQRQPAAPAAEVAAGAWRVTLRG